MIISFSGTRRGMTDEQYSQLELLLRNYNPTVFVQGCCVGADSQAACLADELGIVVYGCPGDMPHLISAMAKARSSFVNPPRDNLERNKLMVDACQLLIACPRNIEDKTGGTWHTIRYATSQNKPRIVIAPNGTYQHQL